MGRRSLLMAAVLGGVLLSACSGSAGHPAAGHPATGPAGSPGRPVVFSCADEVFSSPPVPQRPQPGDLAVGPLIIPGGQRLATADPAGYGTGGSFYKIPFVVVMGAAVTVTIDPPARGHVLISGPAAPAGVTAATYRPCPQVPGFYAQGFTFTDGRNRGCVPLEVRTAGQPGVRRVMLSLFAGSCSG